MVIDTLQLDIIVNNKGTTARINSTTNALKNLHKVISDINGVGGVDSAINGGVGSGSSSRGGSSRSSGKNLGKNLNKAFNIGSIVSKLYFVRNVTKQLGQDVAKVVQYGIDYEETLNLWQVAMKGNTAEARKFITEMNRAYGISEITLMNYQATFKNMLSSLGGINQEVAYGLSETLSQMALDYASLYNTSIESAMTKFQAVLAGQVRPIRSESGYDITQATLYEVYKDIGGTKSVRQLSETEKRLLRILAVYRQMKDTAVGDYAKTITSTANQTRYMQETIKDIATWIGVGANQWLKQSNILIRINAYLLALKELAKSFAINMGYVEESEEKANDPLADIEEGWNGINKQVDEYQGKLLGFDKFQVLSSADTGGGADISAELLKAMQEYKEILDKSQNIALFGDAEKNIQGAYDILKEWGLQLDENGKIVGGFEDIASIIQSVQSPLANLLKQFSNILPVVLAFVGALAKVIVPLDVAVTEIIIALLPIISSVLEPIIDILEPLTYIIKDLGLLIKNIITIFTPTVKSGLSAFLQGLKPLLDIIRLIVFALTWIISAVAKTQVFNGILLLFGGIAEFFSKIVDSINEIISTIAQLDFSGFKERLGKIWEDDNWKIGHQFEYIEKIELPTWFENGGEAKKGSLFYAGEAGPELVTQTSGGNSTIMNMRQLEDAVARGFIRGFAATDSEKDTDTTDIYVDGQRLFDIMRGTAQRNGYDFVRV